jgi:hypothetical protein
MIYSSSKYNENILIMQMVPDLFDEKIVTRSILMKKTEFQINTGGNLIRKC